MKCVKTTLAVKYIVYLDINLKVLAFVTEPDGDFFDNFSITEKTLFVTFAKNVLCMIKYELVLFYHYMYLFLVDYLCASS